MVIQMLPPLVEASLVLLPFFFLLERVVDIANERLAQGRQRLKQKLQKEKRKRCCCLFSPLFLLNLDLDLNSHLPKKTLQKCSFVDHRGVRIVYRRYASLFFLVGIDRDSFADESEGGAESSKEDDDTAGDNGLATLELIHALVETLDRHFGNVCELDIMFNLEAAHYVLDEMLCTASGEVAETNKLSVLQPLELMERATASAQGG